MKERLAIPKFALRRKDADVFDDSTEFKSFIRPRSAELL